MRYFGLLGYPLTHSFSQKYFTEKFQALGITDCVYENFSIPEKKRDISSGSNEVGSPNDHILRSLFLRNNTVKICFSYN